MQCPVCKKEILKQSIKNHIIGMAKSEVWDNFIVKKETPHANFYKGHTKIVTKICFLYE